MSAWCVDGHNHNHAHGKSHRRWALDHPAPRSSRRQKRSDREVMEAALYFRSHFPQVVNPANDPQGTTK